MKKRILALFLAVITVVQLCTCVLPIVAKDLDSVDDESIVGTSVRFNTSDMVYMYHNVTESGPSSKTIRVSPDSLPMTFVVLDAITVSYGTQFYKLGTVDGSANDILDTYPWAKAALFEIVSMPGADGMVEGEVGLLVDGEYTDTLYIKRDEKNYVYTKLSQVFTGTPTYRWELLIDRDQDKWGIIQDYVYPYAAISHALIANAGIEGSAAVLRCVASWNDTDYVSSELNVALEPLDEPVGSESGNATEPLAASFAQSQQFSMLRASVEPTSQISTRDMDAFQVVVQYVYWNNSPLPEAGHGETALPTYTATVGDGFPLTSTVPSLDIAGYKPYIRDDSNPAGARAYAARENPADPDSAVEVHYYVEAPSIAFSNQTTAYEEIIYYLPEMVSFTVNHHIQNLDNDEYMLYHTDDLMGYSLSPVGTDRQMADLYGFSNLFYDPNTPISPNGNTTVDIYYDREYYLIDVELSDGYGVMPLYVRYDTTVQVGTPQRPGYAFTSWTLNRVYTRVETTVDGRVEVTETEITDQTIKNQYSNPSNAFAVQHNLKYTANWSVATTNYTLVYWLENTDSTDSTNKSNYSVWHTKVYSANTGDTTVRGQDDIKSNVTGTALTEVNTDYPFLTYNADLTDTNGKTVNADGTTTVNVYYQRNTYTLRFYYAQQNGSSWYIASMTDYFGNSASSRIDRNNEQQLLDNLGQWAQVTSEPKLKDGAATKNGYTESSISYNGKTYKYFQFTAKYGADIGSKWPVDAVGTVNRNSGSNSGWTKTTSVMSAWTGEYNVKHQHNNPNGSANQTIKGKYEVLDEYLMWDPSYSGWNTEYNDGTISFLCFWENANTSHGWNIPELYRYKIWLPTIAGETYQTTVTRNGVTYYLADTYDTCDNSTASEQTHPSLTGYKKNGYVSVPSNGNDNGDIFSASGYNSLSNNQYLTQDEYNNLKSRAYTDVYKRAYIVNYFYTRNTHQLIMNDNAGSAPETSLAYGTKLNEYNVEPKYPIVYEEGNYTFGGWYQDQACTIGFNFDTTMPDKNVQLYAKWNPTAFSFTVYQEKPTDNNPNPTVLCSYNNVTFGTMPNTLGKEPSRQSPIPDYIFAGWYYEDEIGDEHRFDFNTMPIKHNYEIYAKWTSEVPVHYIVYYRTEINGVMVDIAEPTEGKALAGVAKSFMAKVDLELYEGYRTGYFPLAREQTHKMKHLQDGDGVNEVTFVYVTGENLVYRIRHVFESESFVDKIGTNRLEMVWPVQVTTATSAKLEENFQDEITESNVKAKLMGKMGYSATTADALWEIIIHLSPDAFNKSIVLIPTADETQNEITFNWSGQYDLTIYEVHHMCQGTDGNYYLRGEPRVYDARYTEDATIELPTSLAFTGYNYVDYKTNNNNTKSLQLKKASATQKGLIVYLYKGALTPSCIVQKNPQVPHTAQQVACHP